MLSQLARITLATVFVGSVAFAGCSGPASTNPPGTNVTAEAKSGPQGHAPIVDLALTTESLKLRADQRKTLETVQTDLQAKTGDVRKEGKALALALASSLEAGKLDHDTIDPQVAKVKSAIEAQKPVHQAAMQKLHDTLDKEQRQALVEAMHDKFKGHHEGFGKGGFHMKKLLGDLNLTSDQKDALHAAMKAQFKGDHKEKGDSHEWGKVGKEHMKKLADTFVSDDFDATKAHMGMHPEAFAMKAAKFVEVAIPILDADQRATLAKKIRAHAEKMN